jgi:hypothetical protein
VSGARTVGNVLVAWLVLCALGFSVASCVEKSAATQPAPPASASARDPYPHRTKAILECESGGGTVVMGFGFQVVCIHESQRTITTDTDTGAKRYRGFVEHWRAHCERTRFDGFPASAVVVEGPAGMHTVTCYAPQRDRKTGLVGEGAELWRHEVP